MNQGWAMDRQVEAHRRDLATMASIRRSERPEMQPDAPPAASGPAARHPAPGLPIAGGRVSRRTHPLGERVGSWLIQAGTRLGGASIRTS